MLIDCDHFRAEQGPGGRIRLHIVGAKKTEVADDASYEAERALERLSELLGRRVTRGNLAYWREHMGLPYRKLGTKKFIYHEGDLVRWCRGRFMLA